MTNQPKPNKGRPGFSLAEVLVAISLGAFVFLTMNALYSFTSKALQSVSRKNIALANFSRAVETIKRKAASASYLYLPNQNAVDSKVLAGYTNASYPDFITPIDSSKDPEFFYACMSDTTEGKTFYLYTGKLTKARLLSVVFPCGADVDYGEKVTLLNSAESGDFDVIFSRPKTPANQLAISFLSNNPSISSWLKWKFIALTQQPATINSPAFSL